MVYILLFFLISLSSSLTWCPLDPSLLSSVNTVVRQTSSPSFIPQCAGISLIGCMTLYSWYSCNEKFIKLTTLCGALASSYILYKYVNNQEEVKDLVLETTEHISQAVVESEMRINSNLQIVDARTQQQISHAQQTLQKDLINLQHDMQQTMDASLTELREQLLDMQKNNKLNHMELEQTMETSFMDLEHNAAQRCHELYTMIEQKKEESDKLLQESTNYTITQMQSMFQEFARAQSITLSLQKHSFTPQKFSHMSPPPQVVRRSASQSEIHEEQLQPTLAYRQPCNHEFEQTKQALKQKYIEQQKSIIEQHAAQKATLQSISACNNQEEYQHGTLTTAVILPQITFDAPQATPFTQKSTLSTRLTTNEQSKTGWFNMFALFNIFTR